MPRSFAERKALDMGYWCPVPGCRTWQDNKAKIPAHLQNGLEDPCGFYCIACNEQFCGTRALNPHLDRCQAWATQSARTGMTKGQAVEAGKRPFPRNAVILNGLSDTANVAQLRVVLDLGHGFSQLRYDYGTVLIRTSTLSAQTQAQAFRLNPSPKSKALQGSLLQPSWLQPTPAAMPMPPPPTPNTAVPTSQHAQSFNSSYSTSATLPQITSTPLYPAQSVNGIQASHPVPSQDPQSVNAMRSALYRYPSSGVRNDGGNRATGPRIPSGSMHILASNSAFQNPLKLSHGDQSNAGANFVAMLGTDALYTTSDTTPATTGYLSSEDVEVERGIQSVPSMEQPRVREMFSLAMPTMVGGVNQNKRSALDDGDEKGDVKEAKTVSDYSGRGFQSAFKGADQYHAEQHPLPDSPAAFNTEYVDWAQYKHYDFPLNPRLRERTPGLTSDSTTSASSSRFGSPHFFRPKNSTTTEAHQHGRNMVARNEERMGGDPYGTPVH